MNTVDMYKYLDSETNLIPEGYSGTLSLETMNEADKLFDEIINLESEFFLTKEDEHIQELDNFSPWCTSQETFDNLQYSMESTETGAANKYLGNSKKTLDSYLCVNYDDELKCMLGDSHSLLSSTDENTLETVNTYVRDLNLEAPTSWLTSKNKFLGENLKVENVTEANKSTKCSSENHHCVRNKKAPFPNRTSENPKGRFLYKCDYCSKKFRIKGDLLTHIKQHSSIWCEVCSKSFVDKRSFLLHLKLHTGRRIFRCYTCGLKMNSIVTFINHKKTHFNQSGRSRIPCRYCRRVFQTISSWSVHVRRVHFSRTKRDSNYHGLLKTQTIESSTGVESHKDHKTSISDNLQYLIKSAEKITTNSNLANSTNIPYSYVSLNYNDHPKSLHTEYMNRPLLRTRADDILKPVEKRVSDLNMEAPISWKTCINNMLGENVKFKIVSEVIENTKYSPQNCDRVTNLHNVVPILPDHANDGTRAKFPHKCDYCSKEFRLRSEFVVHIKEHSSRLCEVCLKSFADNRSFLLHLELHKGRRIFRCNECGLKMDCFTTFMNHDNTHSNQPRRSPIRCRFCKKVFQTISSCSIHVRRAHFSRSLKKYTNQADLKLTPMQLKVVTNNHRVWKGDSFCSIRSDETTPEVVSCPMCGDSSILLTDWKKHSQKHIQELGYKCLTCDKSFLDSQSLKKHSAIHSQKRKTEAT